MGAHSFPPEECVIYPPIEHIIKRWSLEDNALADRADDATIVHAKLSFMIETKIVIECLMRCALGSDGEERTGIGWRPNEHTPKKNFNGEATQMCE